MKYLSRSRSTKIRSNKRISNTWHYIILCHIFGDAKNAVTIDWVQIFWWSIAKFSCMTSLAGSSIFCILVFAHLLMMLINLIFLTQDVLHNKNLVWKKLSRSSNYQIEEIDKLQKNCYARWSKPKKIITLFSVEFLFHDSFITRVIDLSSYNSAYSFLALPQNTETPKMERMPKASLSKDHLLRFYSEAIFRLYYEMLKGPNIIVASFFHRVFIENIGWICVLR